MSIDSPSTEYKLNAIMNSLDLSLVHVCEILLGAQQYFLRIAISQPNALLVHHIPSQALVALHP
jgi:hypothetical protein